jgi:hypothetical protein
LGRNRLRTEENQLVKFTVEGSLADYLNGLQNKSMFIRNAVMTHLGLACPACHTSGVVPRGLVRLYGDAIEAITPHCDGCDTPLPLPRKVQDYEPADHARIEQFLLGGELFCAKCYDDVPTCEECPWHVSVEAMAEHIKNVHRK